VTSGHCQMEQPDTLNLWQKMKSRNFERKPSALVPSPRPFFRLYDPLPSCVWP
jgi:hypothetical protein